MRTSFGILTGLDLSGTLVHRGPAVSAQARAYQARAFTRSGGIFLPDEEGSLDQPEARALVAHELVHVIQQSVMPQPLPSEESPDGQQLESEAVSAEAWFRQNSTQRRVSAEQPVTRDKERPADLDDPVSLDELADKVYPRLRRLLRGELLADRERAGLLGDFG